MQLNHICFQTLINMNGFRKTSKIIENECPRDILDYYNNYLVSIFIEKVQKYTFDHEFKMICDCLSWTTPCVERYEGGKKHRRILLWVLIRELEVFFIPYGNIYRKNNINVLYKLVLSNLKRIQRDDIKTCETDIKYLFADFGRYALVHISPEMVNLINEQKLPRIDIDILHSIAHEFYRILDFYTDDTARLLGIKELVYVG